MCRVICDFLSESGCTHHPCLEREQDRRIQDVMRCQQAEERFLLGRDLGPQTGLRAGAGSLLLAVHQRL